MNNQNQLQKHPGIQDLEDPAKFKNTSSKIIKILYDNVREDGSKRNVIKNTIVIVAKISSYTLPKSLTVDIGQVRHNKNFDTFSKEVGRKLAFNRAKKINRRHSLQDCIVAFNGFKTHSYISKNIEEYKDSLNHIAELNLNGDKVTANRIIKEVDYIINIKVREDKCIK